MRGEFIGAWSETWREIWEPLAMHELAPDDLFCELYSELNRALKTPRPVLEVTGQPGSLEPLVVITESLARSREEFERAQSDNLAGERQLVAFLEEAYSIIEDVGGDPLANHYFNLLSNFVAKFSLRYDLRRPCVLCPTLPGVFTSLMTELERMASQNAGINALLRDYKESIRDLRYDCSDNRIKTCIGKQFMLLEAMGAICPGVTENSLGKMCDEIGHWPHATIKESLKKLYGFSSDYPGIRHGNVGGGALRDLEMRDLVAVSVLLAGFTPYLNAQFNAETVYRGQ